MNAKAVLEWTLSAGQVSEEKALDIRRSSSDTATSTSGTISYSAIREVSALAITMIEMGFGCESERRPKVAGEPSAPHAADSCRAPFRPFGREIDQSDVINDIVRVVWDDEIREIDVPQGQREGLGESANGAVYRTSLILYIGQYEESRVVEVRFPRRKPFCDRGNLRSSVQRKPRISNMEELNKVLCGNSDSYHGRQHQRGESGGKTTAELLSDPLAPIRDRADSRAYT
ncbi:uncharacterized protein EV420DRAFT_1746280, partial [Desarmillaria tabescens]